MALIMTVMPVMAAGNPTGETQWGGETYIHTVDVTEKIIKKGIDVSYHQGNIDWAKVKADEDADISFAFIRIGYPVYTDAQTAMFADLDLAEYDPETCDAQALEQLSGSARAVQVANFYVDDKFEYNLSEAIAAGIDAGIYFFSRAITPNEAAAEAQWVLAELEELGYTSDDLALPIVFDYEYEDNAGRVYDAGLSSEQKTAICNAFCQVVTDAGYQAGVYANRSMFTEAQKIDAAKLNEGTKVWLAQYNTQSTYTGNYDFWQCTDAGTVDGITTSVDFDFGYFPVEEGDVYQFPSGELKDATVTTSEYAITLSWESVESADGYSILRASRWNGALELLGSVENTQGICTYTDADISTDYEYYYRIYPYVSDEDGTKIYADGTDIIPAYIRTVSKRLITTTDNLKLRAHAGTGDIEILYQLPDGSVLDWITDTKASNGVVWNKVSYTAAGKTYTGYVSSDYTKVHYYPVRISGTTRYETSFETADMLKSQLKVDKFENIIVATGENFADALSGSYLAYVYEAPIILTSKKDVSLVQRYIKENLADGGTVYVLGGTGAIPDTLEKGLAAYNVERLYGKSRYDTNLEILKAAGVSDEELLVCTGQNFADSLSASAAKRPILLVNKDVTEKQSDYLDSVNIDKFYIIGGEGAVNAEIEEELKSMGTVKRIGGKTRYETSVNVASEFVKNPNAAVLAYSMNYPDGVSGGPLAMALDAPLILTMTGKEDAAEKYVDNNDCYDGYILGGSKLISDASVKQIFGENPSEYIGEFDPDADPLEGATDAELYGIFFENTYGEQTYETYQKIGETLIAKNEYMLKSSYHLPLVQYWENVRGVTDIGYRIDPLYYTDMKYYTAKDFDKDPAEVIKIAKNEIYARHGYIFGNRDLYNYFMGCAWYEPTIEASEFDTSVFNKYEVHNLKILNGLDQ